eukprot:2283917-Prymnesium_polylepis.1
MEELPRLRHSATAGAESFTQNAAGRSSDAATAAMEAGSEPLAAAESDMGLGASVYLTRSRRHNATVSTGGSEMLCAAGGASSHPRITARHAKSNGGNTAHVDVLTRHRRGERDQSKQRPFSCSICGVSKVDILFCSKQGIAESSELELRCSTCRTRLFDSSVTFTDVLAAVGGHARPGIARAEAFGIGGRAADGNKSAL